MKKSVLLLWILCLVFVAVSAKPFPRPENDDEELLVPKETVHYPYAFWVGRPFYDQDEDGDNTYRKSPALSLTSVGAGWGR